jgi:two-component system phosphate regulon response regulator OmpR
MQLQLRDRSDGTAAAAAADRGSLLIVDDEQEIRDTLREYFAACGFDVYVAADGDVMRAVVAQRRIDVVLMDLNLPGDDGLTLTRQLRESRSHDVGIIMLTAAGQTVDRIVGLEIGADDYVPKPFDPREVLARVKSVLRRLRERPRTEQAGPDLKPEMVKMGACTLDLAAHRLYRPDGSDIPLTSMEFDLLKTFAEHPDRVLSRNQLLEFAHHRSAAPFDRSIDLRIMRIRKKIETDPDDPQVLKTIRGIGYLFASGRKR